MLDFLRKPPDGTLLGKRIGVHKASIGGVDYYFYGFVPVNPDTGDAVGLATEATAANISDSIVEGNASIVLTRELVESVLLELRGIHNELRELNDKEPLEEDA